MIIIMKMVSIHMFPGSRTIYIYISSPFPFVGGDVLPATFSPPHLIVFSTLLCLFSTYSSLPPLLSSTHLSSHSPPISALASLVSSCPADVTLPLSSVVCHPPSFLRVQPTVIFSSPVSLSNFSALPSLPLTPPFFSGLPSLLLLFFFVPSCFRTLASFVVVVQCSARVSVPYWHARVTHVLMTLQFSLFEIRRSAITPSTRSLRPVLFDVPLYPSSRLRTRPLLGT